MNGGALLEPVRIFADFQTELSKAEVAPITEERGVVRLGVSKLILSLLYLAIL